MQCVIIPRGPITVPVNLDTLEMEIRALLSIKYFFSLTSVVEVVVTNIKAALTCDQAEF